MKLSIITTVLSFALLTACGDDPPAAPASAAPVTEPAPAEATPPPAGPVRSLVKKRALSTAPHNLLVDPEFQSLWTPIDETGFGLYEAFVQEGESGVMFLAETPTAAGAAVLSVKPNAGGEASLTMTVRGGKGPLAASVWVAAPEGGLTPEVQLASLRDSKAILLEPVAGSERTVAGIKWVELRGATTEDMPGLLYFVGAARGAGTTRFLAPEITSAAVPKAAGSVHGAGTPTRVSTARALEAARSFAAFRAAHVTMSAPPKPKLPPPAR